MESHDYQNDFHKWGVPAIDNLLAIDPKLRDFQEDIRRRYAIFEKTKTRIEKFEGIDRFTESYKEFGVIFTPEGGVMCKEWIPNVRAVYLSGEFNNWEKWGYEKKAYGKWEMYIHPNFDGTCRIPHLSELKLWIETNSGQRIERISPWAKYVVHGDDVDDGYSAKWLFWNPARSEVCLPTNGRPKKPLRLRIYEAHIGIASEHCQISTYRQFTENVLHRIKDLGYNCVLLMAILEHPRYDDLGHQISNFFAASSRYGTPNDLKNLVNVAHGMGIIVIIDVAHNHASSNIKDGINKFNGTDSGYFYEEKRGYENGRETRIFNFSKWEVVRFLLSSLRYFMEEFNVDGFRFHSVTSMIYNDQTGDIGFSDDYRQYFGMHMNLESMAYLTLANDMIHSFYPNAITIAEDVSEMPGLCRPIREGGIGFDYRLGLSVPNKWMKLLDECKDENWNMGFIFHAMTKRRNCEKVIACTETQQQSMVGKQTIISKLLGHEIVDNMSDLKPLTPRVDRGLNLHKMMRLMTHALVGDGYMNFIGNEFGHPDFLEFPCSKNNKSYHYARRRFDLCDNEELRFKYLQRFDRALNQTEEQFNWLSAPPGYVSRKHDGDKVFVFERANLLFIFNFHPTQTYIDYRVGTNGSGSYKIILDTDDQFFGGRGRNQASNEFHLSLEGFDNRNNSVMIYLPSRCGIVMANTQLLDTSCQQPSGESSCTTLGKAPVRHQLRAYDCVFDKTLNDMLEGGHEDWLPCLPVHLMQIFNRRAQAWIRKRKQPQS